MTKDELKRRVRAALAKVTKASPTGLIGQKSDYGKIYEAYVLAVVADGLVVQEGSTLRLVRGSKVALKAKGGPINQSFPYIDVTHPSRGKAQLWTNIYFLALSYVHTRIPQIPQPCDYHELDVALVADGAVRYPTPDQVWLAVECKETLFGKNLLREVLGLRRELSLLAPPSPTGFVLWPAVHVPANPPSCVSVYTTDASVTQWQPAGTFFGITFVALAFP